MGQVTCDIGHVRWGTNTKYFSIALGKTWHTGGERVQKRSSNKF